jgi:hypothetical protein
LEASTLFGIKGEGFVATTGEYYNGHYTEIQDSFRSYPNVASAVVGYYDFLATTPRFAGAICNPDYKDAVDKLIHTTDGAPYATDPDYITKVVSIIEQYGLTQYDTREESGDSTEAPTSAKTIDEVANAVIRGEYGNNPERRERLLAEGYDADAVQARVDELMDANTTPAKTIDEVANAVIRGEYGNNPERRERLLAEGYDADAVQARVDELM